MRAIVTGSGGFVGSALSRALSRAGHDVVALTREPARAAVRIGAGARVVSGSIATPREIALAAQGASVLFHCAGIAALDAPERVLRWVHLAGTENVLRAARAARVRRIVFISCADVSLTDEDRMHWDEKRLLTTDPIGPHARSKLLAEEVALAASDDALEVTALRPALLWGPDDVDGLAALVRGLRAGTFTLYGGGRNLLATTHIDKLVEAALLAARAPSAPSRAYYVTDGEFIEAREFYTRLCAALGLPPPPLRGSLPAALARTRAREIFTRQSDAGRAAILRRATSALFDVSRATLDLGYEAKLDLPARMEELTRWVAQSGGAEALLPRARALPSEADIAAQVEAAGGA